MSQVPKKYIKCIKCILILYLAILTLFVLWIEPTSVAMADSDITIDASRTDSTIVVTIDASAKAVAAGTVHLRYELNGSQLIRCTAAANGLCNVSDELIKMNFVDAEGLTGTYTIAELSFDSDDVRITGLSVVTMVDGLLHEVPYNTSINKQETFTQKSTEIFLPLIEDSSKDSLVSNKSTEQQNAVVAAAQLQALLFGDVTCDGRMDVVDALAIMQHVVDLRLPAYTCPLDSPNTMLNVEQADVNNSGAVDAVDALWVMQCVVDIANGLCPSEQNDRSLFEIVSIDAQADAIEATGQKAEVLVRRTGASGALSLQYRIAGTTEASRTSAAPEEMVIRDTSGNILNGTVLFANGQMTQVITVEAIADDAIEVPERFRLVLQPSADYGLNPNATEAALILRDDEPGITEESRLFFGNMMAEGNAITSANGTAVIRLSGDNSFGRVDYTFSNLTTVQTAAHIHYANPDSGPIIFSFPLGQIEDERWDIEAAFTASTDQAMLDSLFAGRLYINVHSQSYVDGEIRTTMRLTEGSTEMQPPPPAPPIEALSGADLKRDISRFLTQASFGPTVESVAELETRIANYNGDRMRAYSDWIDEQMALEAPSLLEFYHAAMPLFYETNGGEVIEDTSGRTEEIGLYPGWYTSTIYGKAQLRERIAFALSEIFVVSNADNNIRRYPWSTTSYYDMLKSNAFGSFEDLLLDVSTHPTMGQYLSHLKNEPEQFDFAGNVITSPDENYAREIMQLFSIGLVMRHMDGSLELGANGLPIRTYTQTDVTELARIFTGWSYSVKMVDGGLTNRSVPNDDFYYDDREPVGQQYYKPYFTVPMRNFSQFHDNGEKNWLGRNFPANQTGDQEMATVVNILSNHPNAGVFISHQIIQRLVTSNPSAGYLYRVAQTFEQTDGDIGEVVKAILLDPEARNLSQTTQVGHGRIKEPLVQMVALLRLLKPVPSTADTINFQALQRFDYPQSQVRLFESDADLMYLKRCLADCTLAFDQPPLYAPNVFNYFMPDFAPPGPVIDAGIVAPELQMMDESNTIGLYNAVQQLVLTTTGIKGIHPQHRTSSARIGYVQPQWVTDAYMNIMDTNGDGEITSNDASFNNATTIRNASAALVDLADDYICSGRLQAKATGNAQTDAREIITKGVYDALKYLDGTTAAKAATARDERIRETFFLVTSAPQCTYME